MASLAAGHPMRTGDHRPVQAPPALEIAGISRAYRSVTALRGVDLRIEKGEQFCLLGPSGSGKTTLLRVVAGFETADTGTVAIDGRRVDGVPPERRGLGVVFQDYALFPHRTVAENVAFGLRMRRVPRRQRAERVAEMLDLVQLTGLENRRPETLSGGQRQRVALARALAPGPELLLLDEPLANLDRRLREAMREELARIQRAVGVTIVLVTHDQEEALSLATRIGVMNEGRLEQVGSPTTLWRRPATRFVARFLGEMNLVPARLDAAGTAVLDGLGERVPVAGGAPPGDLVACLRPEALAIARPGAADPGQSADPDRSAAPGGPGAAGRVGTVAYAGGSVTYRVVLDSGLSLLVREALADGVPGFRPGDPVAVSTRNVPCTLLPS